MLNMVFFRIIIISIILFSTPLYADSKVEIDYPNTPVIYNTTMTSANTEYSQALPSGCTKIMVQCRTSYDVKITYVSGESGTIYFTIKADDTYWDDNIFGTKQTLYVQCTTAGQVLEILAWSD